MNITPLTTFLKQHYPKLLSIFFFILLSAAYVQTFAVFAPGESLSPNCQPGDAGCYVQTSGGSVAWGSITGAPTALTAFTNDAGYVTASGARTALLGMYEVPLTFSTGLSRSTNTITNNLSTGISGGQSVIGGTASGNNLTLSSTSNATKGKILFGTSAYDEVNNRLGVGTTSPSYTVDVNGTLHTTGTLTLNTLDIRAMGTRSISIGASLPSLSDSFLAGFGAGSTASNASYSNFIGNNAGNSATNAQYANFLGYNAGMSATNASNSNFLGYQSGYQASSASSSNFIGSGSGFNAAGASYSNFLGGSAGNSATNASNSNFLGQATGYSAINASYSNIFGYNAGREDNSGIHIGSNNIIIGTNISLPNATTNAINLGGVLFGTGTYSTTSGNPSITPVSGGKIGIGIVSPNHILDVNGNIGLVASSYINFGSTDGASGYGIKDNGGILQYKNSGGSWGNIGSISLDSNSSLMIGGGPTSALSNQQAVLIGKDAGNNASNASRSNFIGFSAGNNAVNATQSNFIGTVAGQAAVNASYSNFIGSGAGGSAPNANNSIFIGQNAGYSDTVNNTSNGLSSILIGSFTNTGGYSNSILLGSGTSGSAISNTKANQFMLAPSITEARFRGIDYTFPVSQGSSGQVLTNNGSGGLSWTTVGGGGGGSIAGSIDEGQVAVGTSLGTIGGTSLTYVNNNLTFGYVQGGGNISAQSTASQVFGVSNGGQMYTNSSSSLVFGIVDVDANSKIYTTGDSSIAFGFAGAGASLYTTDTGGNASGYVYGEDGNGNFSYISAGQGARASGSASGGGFINANDVGSIATGAVDGSDGNGNLTHIQADSIGAIASGYATGGGLIYAGSMGSLSHGYAVGNDGLGNYSYLQANGTGSTASGYTSDGGYILAQGSGSQAHGYALGSDGNGILSFISTNSNATGSQAFGSVTNGGGIYTAVNTKGSLAFGSSNAANGVISTGDQAAFAFGRITSISDNGQISSNGAGALAFGSIEGVNGSIQANALGSQVFGISNGGSLHTQGGASLVFGTTDSNSNSQIYTGSDNSLAFGYASGGASVSANADGGAFTSGYADGEDGNGNFSYIHTNGYAARTHGYADGGAYIQANGYSALAYGYASSSDGNGNVSHIVAQGESSQAFGSVYGGAYIQAADRAFAFGTAQSTDVNGNQSYIYANAEESFAWGATFNGGSIMTSATASQAFGFVDGHDVGGTTSQLINNGEGAFAFGDIYSGGQISNQGNGSFAAGTASNLGLITTTNPASFAFGYANGNLSVIQTNSIGSIAIGYTDAGGQIIAGGSGNYGSTATGVAAGPDSVISAPGHGSFATGVANTAGKIIATNVGTFAGGVSDNGFTILSNGNGAFAYGLSDVGDISAIGSGAFALGASITGEVRAQGNASIAFGDDVQTYSDYGGVFGQHGIVAANENNSFLFALGGTTTTLDTRNSFAVGYNGGMLLKADTSGVTTTTLTVSGALSATLPSGSFGTIASFGANGGPGLVTIGYEDGSGISSITGSGFGPFQIASSANNNILISPGSGNVGIGVVSPSYILDVGNSSISGTVAQFTNLTGSCTINPTTSSVGCSSDINLKKNITTLTDNTPFTLSTITLPTNNNSFLSKLALLTPVSYNWKTESDTDSKHTGFIAQQVEQVFPDLVSTDPVTNLKSVNYMGFSPYVVQAVGEMGLRIQSFLPDDIDAGGYAKLKLFFAGIVQKGEVLIDKVTAKQLCADDICVNRTQLKEMIDYIESHKDQPATQTVSGETSVPPPATTTPPATPVVETEVVTPATPLVDTPTITPSISVPEATTVPTSTDTTAQ